MRKLWLTILVLILPNLMNAADVVVSQDITTNTTWTSDNVYFLNGLIFVDSLNTLTIQAGTVVKGYLQSSITTGDGASALIVRRGAKINADGTAQAPIIFTTELDDVTDPLDLGPTDRGLWGGVLVLGRATTNQPDTSKNQVEGIPLTENARYGGNNDADNSGVLRYVSIRHGGFSISGIPGDEINGLTLGAVGSGTTVAFVEVFANFDDGFEWFGGTVNTRYLVTAFCADDAFDYDQGFRGKHQFWFSIQSTDEAGRAGEHDGGDDDETGLPYSIPVINNVTYIGAGASSTGVAGDGNDRCLYFRDNAGGKYSNSIFTDFVNIGLNIEDLTSGDDSRLRMEQGDLMVSNNLWYGFGAGSSISAISSSSWVADHLNANSNSYLNPMLRGIDRSVNSQGLDPRPMFASPAVGSANLINDPFFFPATYRGAFDPNKPLWTNDWTAIDALGVTGDLSGGQPGSVIVSNNINQNTTWTANNVYSLNGLIFVDSLYTLTIQPGTVIKGYLQSNITTGDGASALIVRRGAKLVADGTAQAPIIFTSELDEVNDPNDLGIADRGLWGGLLILGRATTNQPDTSKNQVEGIPLTENARYGGNNDTDNSGVLRYVSIRHGGFSISGIPGDEINGVTFGAVGSQTVVENVEVFANFDDGFEWFGGTVNTKNLVAAFCADDAFDYDQGFRGNHQFWFAIQATDEAGRGGEHDGGDDDETGLPFSIPVISNVTYIGAGVSSTGVAGDGNDRCLYFRDNAGGKYYSSIFIDFVNIGLNIEDLTSGDDSRLRMEQGDLLMTNNLWFDFGAGSTLQAISSASWVADHLVNNNNQYVDPQLVAISRETNATLDPRPSPVGPAASGAVIPANPFFTAVSYRGAFDPAKPLWTRYWTALWQNGITVLNIKEERLSSNTLPREFTLNQNYPNPFNPSTRISFTLPNNAFVKLSVYNTLGQEVATLVEGPRAAGEYSLTWNAVGMASGIYFYRLETGSTAIIKRMILMR